MTGTANYPHTVEGMLRLLYQNGREADCDCNSDCSAVTHCRVVTRTAGGKHHMRVCDHHAAIRNDSITCDQCGAELAKETHSAGRDDVSRILHMYGAPDRDTFAESMHLTPESLRVLEYKSARIVFTFVSESRSESTETCARWKLLLITDATSQNAMTAPAAAARFFTQL